MSNQTHPFDAAIHLEPDGDGRWRGHTHESYGNMVGPFGGITAAATLAAVLAHPARQGDPIALTVNFAGPVTPGPFDVQATAVRTNRSTQHWSVQIHQGIDVVATATAVLATRRQTWSAVEADFPQAPAAESIARTPPSWPPSAANICWLTRAPSSSATATSTNPASCGAPAASCSR